MAQERVLLKVSEVAQRLGIARTTAYELIARGDLPGALRVGQSIRVNTKVLDRWIEEASAGPKPAA